MPPVFPATTAADADQVLNEFLHSTYEGTGELGGWDRAALEADPYRWDHR